MKTTSTPTLHRSGLDVWWVGDTTFMIAPHGKHWWIQANNNLHRTWLQSQGLYQQDITTRREALKRLCDAWELDPDFNLDITPEPALVKIEAGLYKSHDNAFAVTRIEDGRWMLSPDYGWDDLHANLWQARSHIGFLRNYSKNLPIESYSSN